MLDDEGSLCFLERVRLRSFTRTALALLYSLFLWTLLQAGDTFAQTFRALWLSNSRSSDGQQTLQSHQPEGPGWLSPEERIGLRFKAMTYKRNKTITPSTPLFYGSIKGPRCGPSHQHRMHRVVLLAMVEHEHEGGCIEVPTMEQKQLSDAIVEWQINNCRVNQQGVKALNYESDELLALSSWVALPLAPWSLTESVDSQHSQAFLRGRTSSMKNALDKTIFSCANCHTDHYSQKLGGETISPRTTPRLSGLPFRVAKNGLSAKTVASAASQGVKAVIFPFGSQELTELELYLHFRGQGAPNGGPWGER
jgi:hypothetical protein